MKKFYKSGENIHFGVIKIEGYADTSEEEVEKAISNLGKRKLWRCNVCNDLFIGEIPPKQCPTCYTMDAYMEINEKEFREMMK